MTGSRHWRQQGKPRITPDDVRFADFAGVVNTRSRKDVGMKALYVGDNVVISDTKKIVRRPGYAPVRESGTVQSAYGLNNELYIVEGGNLIHMLDTEDRTLVSGLTGTSYVWDVQNGAGYYVNGVEAGIVHGDLHLPWRLTVPQIMSASVIGATAPDAPPLNFGQGYTTALFRLTATYETFDGRETAPGDIIDLPGTPETNLIRVTVPTGYARTNVYSTEADGTVFRLVASMTGTTATFNPARGGRELTTLNMASLPVGATHVAFVKGRCAVGQYLPDIKTSVVWISQPFAYHLFDMEKDYHPVAGQIGLMLWTGEGVLIGTTEKVYHWFEESGELRELANYGVPMGVAGDVDAVGKAYFWTVRGICRALPFENLTETNVSMAPGSRVTASLVYINGLQQFIAVTQGGGTPFNAREERS